MPDVKRKWQVLFRNKPAWIVSEKEADALKRRLLQTDTSQSEHLYPRNYAGKVISICPETHVWSEKDLACPTRSLAILDLSDEELLNARSGIFKIDRSGEKLVLCTFADRYGATASSLLKKFPDAILTTEDDEDATINAVLEANRTHQLAFEDAVHIWKREAAEAFVAKVSFDEPKPLPPLPSPVPEPVFGMEVVRLRRKLAKTIVHSGVGLYEVGSGKTYSTIQSALDQLWTDQGSAAFTATQEIRVYDGTYNEQVDPTGFAPRARYHLVINAASKNSPTIDCTGVDHAFYTSAGVPYIDVEGFTISGVTNAGKSPIAPHYGCRELWFRKCTITAYSASAPGDGALINSCYQGLYFEDCEIDGSGAGYGGVVMSRWGNVNGFFRCVIHGFSIIDRGFSGGTFHMEGCTVHDILGWVFSSYSADRHRPWVVDNNTFYDIGAFIRFANRASPDWFSLRNNIFHTVGVVFEDAHDYEKFDHARTLIDGNCYYNVTKWLQSVNETDIADFATWQARGYDADGIEADPLFTDPGAGDFSLAVGSPCIRRVPPAGVVKDVDGNLYATDRTDIGAVASGTSSAPPVISGVSVSGNDYTITLVAGGAPNVRVRLMSRGGSEEDEDQRLGSGNITLTGASTGDHVLVAWGCDGAGNPIGEPSAPVVVSVPSVLPSSGSMLRRTPHLVTLKRPTVGRDAENNVATRDYANPIKTVSVQCLFQTRGGQVSVGDEGNIVPFDAKLYTVEEDIQVNDRIEVALSFYTGNFLVTAIEPKGKIRGGYSHNEVLLQKDGVR